MKIYFLFLLAVSLLGVGGCSSDDMNGHIDDLDAIIIDNNVGEVWSGTGVPGWLEDRQMKLALDKLWPLSGHTNHTLWEVYQFNAKGVTLVALRYEHVNGSAYDTGLRCYTNDGRQVDADRVKEEFEQTRKLIWTNRMGGEGKIPVIRPDEEGLMLMAWMQNVVNDICESADKTDGFLLELSLEQTLQGGEIISVFKSERYVRNSGIVKEQRYYTAAGEIMESFNYISNKSWIIHSLSHGYYSE